MERRRAQKGLACFLQGMIGKNICVEIMNEVYVNGILEEADSYMNLKMKNVEIFRDEKVEKAEQYSIEAKHIRFVHFEHSVDAPTVIRKSINKSRKPNKKIDIEQSKSTRKSFE